MVILGVLIGLVAGSLWLPYLWKIRITILMVSAVLCALALEIILLNFWQRGLSGNAIAAENQNVQFDLRTPYQVVFDLRIAGLDAYPGLLPYHFREISRAGEKVIEINGDSIVPLANISMVSTVLCNESGDFVVYDSDERGFNNPRGIWNGDYFQVVTIGDSFTHGICVDPDENASLIRDIYPKTLNLGMGGAGPLMQLGIVREYASQLKPEVLLWFYFEGNDLSDICAELETPLRDYLNNSYHNNLMGSQTELDLQLINFVDYLIEPNFWPFAKTFKTLRLVELRKTISELSSRTKLNLGKDISEDQFVMAPCSSGVSPLIVFQTIMDRVTASVESWGGELYFIYLPAWWRYGSQLDKQLDSDYCIQCYSYESILRMADNSGIPTVDLAKSFAGHSDPLSLFRFRLDGHYNEKGYKLVAETVLKQIDLYDSVYR